jgi:hypothetical protein
MKIGILTYHAVCNFGANLQALSTICYWRNHGYDPIIINWYTEELEDYYRKKTTEEQYKEHEHFRQKFFPMTRRCYNDSDVVSVIKEEGIEAVVVGSDAVMQSHPRRSRYLFPTRHIITKLPPVGADETFPNPFWGSFYSQLETKIPLCFMSASSQNSPYKSSDRNEKQIQKNLLKQFSYISTRDEWTSKQVNWLTDGEIKPLVTPDPVFAFNNNVKDQPTEKEIRQRFGLKGGYCLLSFHSDHVVSQEWLTEIKEKMALRNVQCVAFPFPEGIQFNHPFDKQIDLPLSPMDWYSLIKYSSCYIGENMHPIVICLHNAVPCFCFDQYGIVRFRRFVVEKSSKIYHILGLFGQPENRISIKGFYQEPSVDYVIEKLDSFDTNSVGRHASDCLGSYMKMMSDIENVISTK